MGAKDTYQINAILGYPVFQSLGTVTFRHTGEFMAGSQASTEGAYSRMFMEKLTPLLQCGVHGSERLFAFDTGATGSTFFAPYYREFSKDFAGIKLRKTRTSGVGGERERPVYILKTAMLRVAREIITLYQVPVFPTPLGTGTDQSYGNLGRDLVAAYDSFTLDFAQLRFFLGERLPRSVGASNSPVEPARAKPADLKDY